VKFSKELLAKLGVKVKAPSARRVLGGVEARKLGKQFEEKLEVFGRLQKVEVVRLPDGCKQLGPKALVRVKSPFDFILGHAGLTAMIDTKSTGESTLTMNAMPAHQVNAMLKLARHTRAGFLVWFRKYDSVNFFEIRQAVAAGKMRHDSGVALGGSNSFELSNIFEVSK
jgi:penicillin-binding protein-related factor A (putative recombinase)